MAKESRVETFARFMESQPDEIQLEAGMAASGSLVAIGGLGLELLADQEPLSNAVTGIGLGVLAVGTGLFAINKASDFVVDRMRALTNRAQSRKS